MSGFSTDAYNAAVSECRETKKRLIVLGCTGSIGQQTLDVVRKNPQEFEVVGLAAGTHVDSLLSAAHEFGVQSVAIGCTNFPQEKIPELKQQAAQFFETGPQAILGLIKNTQADMVINALVGAVGLQASYETLRSGMVLALANKESLVVGGDLIVPLANKLDEKDGFKHFLMPIDSEHGALYQCLIGEDMHEVNRLWITASGGPFRGWSRQQLQQVGPKQALAHPTWNMGAKISIDSSTLMNKGLEVIEAHHLFDMPYERIQVVVQPQSAIHSMVEFIDGSVKAHLGTTDMRIPIQYALSYPRRLKAPVQPLDFTTLGSLDFEAPHTELFPCLSLAYKAGTCGGTLPCAMNAANEIAVAAFLEERLSYLGIAQCVETVMDLHCAQGIQKVESVHQLQEIDIWARKEAQVCIGKLL